MKIRTNKKTGIDWNQINQITPEMSYVLGLLWADGYIIKRKTGGWVRLNNVYEDSLYFQKILDKIGNWSKTKYSNKGKQDALRMVIYENKFVEWLRSMDYLVKSEVSPVKILNYIPKELHFLWFLGLIDGDGCIYINPDGKHYKISIASSFNQDWDSVSKILQELNISFKVIQRIFKDSKGSQVEITSRYGIVKLYKYLYNTDFGLPRKREKMKQIVDKLELSWLTRGLVKKLKRNIFEVYDLRGKKKKYIGSAKTQEQALILRNEFFKNHPFIPN